MNLSAFFKQIDNARKRIGISNHPAWYRGHSSVHYKLLPTLLRHKLGLRHERNLYAVFRKKGEPFLLKGINSWSVLAIMQHHGVPTRLLDWTESIDVALFLQLARECLIRASGY